MIFCGQGLQIRMKESIKERCKVNRNEGKMNLICNLIPCTNSNVLFLHFLQISYVLFSLFTKKIAFFSWSQIKFDFWFDFFFDGFLLQQPFNDDWIQNGKQELWLFLFREPINQKKYV